jgi:hypothetical protein
MDQSAHPSSMSRCVSIAMARLLDSRRTPGVAAAARSMRGAPRRSRAGFRESWGILGP